MVTKNARPLDNEVERWVLASRPTTTLLLEQDFPFHRHDQKERWFYDGYSVEDALLDQLDMLPGEARARELVGLLATKHARALATDIFVTSIRAIHRNELLDLARTINGWAATAEELSATRNRINTVLSAREDMRGNPTH